MSVDTPEFVLPKHLDEIDARFMTEALRASATSPRPTWW